MLILFGIKSIAFPLIIKINAELFLLNLTDEDIEKEEVLLFLCYECAVEGKNVRKNVKTKILGYRHFSSKGIIRKI